MSLRLRLLRFHRRRFRGGFCADAGQVTILAVFGLLGIGVIIVALAVIGEAAVERARAQAAADAVALASASDPTAGSELARWYSVEGVELEISGDRVVAHSGPSRAVARADVVEGAASRTPALVAIVVRAEQLVGTPMTPTQWEPFAIAFNAEQALMFATVAPDLGLCQARRDPRDARAVWFEMC